MKKAIENSLNPARQKARRGDGSMVLQESGEMYLETILILGKRKNLVRAIDVSEEMGISKASVSRAIHLLEDGGFLTIESGALCLTDVGREYGERIYERHATLTRCFVALGVDREIAANDACRIEHIISDECFAALKKHFAAFDERGETQRPVSAVHQAGTTA